MSNWVIYFFKYYIETKINKKRKPILAGYKITYNCNLQCVHCPYWRRVYPDPSYKEAIDIIKKMHEMGARILIFEGGEPLLWKDKDENKNIRDLILFAKKLFFSVGITTNGTIKLVDIPSDVIWVSFDGLKETYKKIRGDFFDRIIENIKNSNHKNLLVNITINRINENELEEMVKFISPFVKGITIQFHYPYGIKEDDELFIPLHERPAIIDKLINLKKQGYPISDSYSTLNAMKDNSWICHDWMLINANPDGTITQGCYLKSRGEILCDMCGFAAHVEISKAYDLSLSSINVGRKIFKYRQIDA
ncbi:MAG: DUF3463 domain-containing protein [Proteobacteria bacterium]|nr:DUF3463 domain-containing protein [Pseudomonadota bacterium]